MLMQLTDLVTQAQLRNASDIHLLPNSYVWFRVMGQLNPCSAIYYSGDDLSVLLLGLLHPEQQAHLSVQRHLDCSYQLENGLRLRINIFYRLQGLGAVIRLISPHNITLADLPAPKVLYELVQESHGLILLTGPTGSGKTTTLAAMITEINQTAAKHILTLEDPIEYIHTAHNSLITQREKYTHFLDYPAALYSALREDPDVILIGELREHETMQLALTAAETGHLVFATLHTATAAGTIDRFVDAFPAIQQNTVRSLLAETLVAVISQRLIKTSVDKQQAVFEILRATPAVRQLIRDHNISQLVTAMQTGAEVGMQTFKCGMI